MDKFHRLVLEEIKDWHRSSVWTYVLANGLWRQHHDEVTALTRCNRASLTTAVRRACKQLTLDGLLSAKAPLYRGDQWEFALTDAGRDELDENNAHCLWCGKLIHPGDPCERGGGMSDGEVACEECASTFAGMLAEPGSFVADDSGDETLYHTAETAKAVVDAHLAAGGNLSDKIVEPY